MRADRAAHHIISRQTCIRLLVMSLLILDLLTRRSQAHVSPVVFTLAQAGQGRCGLFRWL